MTLAGKLNYCWRLFATGLAFVVFGIGGMLIPLLAAPALYLLPGGRQVRQVAARRLVHVLFKSFIHMMRLLGILSWKVDGLEKLRRPGLLILANHPTLIDVVFILAFVPNATCIVKSRLLDNAAMRGFIKHAGYIRNDQSVSFIEEAGASLRSGASLVIFPEGTRTQAGKPFAFQRGAANIAIRCGTDITPVVITCAPPTLSKAHRWHDIPPQPVVISFRVKDDISVAPLLQGPATLEARRLTESLEAFFSREYEEWTSRPLARS